MYIKFHKNRISNVDFIDIEKILHFNQLELLKIRYKGLNMSLNEIF